MVCVHTYSESDNTLLRYGHLKFSKMAAGRHLEFYLTGNCAVRSAVPENPTEIGDCRQCRQRFKLPQAQRRSRRDYR